MATKEISAQKKGIERVVTVLKDFPDTAEESIQKYGDKVIQSNWLANYVITLQGMIRSGIAKGQTDEEIQAKIEAAVPGVASDRVVDPIASLKKQYDSKSPEEKAELLARLKTQLGIVE